MQIIKMTFSRAEIMAETGSVRIELKSVIDLSNPLALLQSGGATTAGFFIRNVVNGMDEQHANAALAKITQAFNGHTFDVRRITVPVSYLCDGKANAVQVTRADGSTQTLSSLAFNSVQESDTEQTMLAAARISFANAVMSGRYTLVTQQLQATTAANGGNNAGASQQNPFGNLQGDLGF